MPRDEEAHDYAMTNRDEKQGIGKELTNTTLTGGASGLAAALAQYGPEVATIAATLAPFVPFVASIVFGLGWKAKSGEAERWWKAVLDEVAADEGITPEEAEDRIRSRADEPAVREAIFRSLRALLEREDDAATIPLARLVAEYQRNKAVPDSFFRGVARLLAELSASEFDELRRLLVWAFEGSEGDELLIIAIDETRKSDVHAPGRPHILRFTECRALNEHDGRLDGFEDPTRLLHLLEVHGIGLPPNDPGWFGPNPFRVKLDREVTVRLRRILDG